MSLNPEDKELELLVSVRRNKLVQKDVQKKQNLFFFLSDYTKLRVFFFVLWNVVSPAYNVMFPWRTLQPS